MSIEELSSKGSDSCRESFQFLRAHLTCDQRVQETVEYEPLKESDAPTYKIGETPRVRAFFGENLELFLFIPEKSVQRIQEDDTIPQQLRGLVDRAQRGGMSRLLRVQLAAKKDVELLLPLIKAVTQEE